MIYSGLVSITFRKLKPKEIVALAAKAGVSGIEWGGDIHVPHGNTDRAREVFRMTTDAGLKIAAYGSYYHVGCEESEGIPFERLLDTAVELKAPVIRVWAGDRASQNADAAFWDKVVAESLRISELAMGSNTIISFEYHSNTLTDTGDSAQRLMRAIDRENVKCYWQPPVGLDIGQQIKGLKQIAPWLGNVHVFMWDAHRRLPLAKGIDCWKRYLEVIKAIEGDRFCMIEFVKDDDPDQFLKDAETLKEIIG